MGWRPSKTVVMMAAGAGVLAAVGVAVGSLQWSSGRSEAAVKPVKPVRVVIAHDHRGKVPWNGGLGVRVHRGSIRTVTVTSASGQAVMGLSSGKASWHTSAKRLLPDTAYDVSVTAADEVGTARTITRHVRTTPAKHYLTGLLSPNDTTVGVGEPVSLHLSAPVPEGKRASIERHLTVTTKPGVRGAWHWFDDQDLHWRPRHYWHPGTVVQVRSDLSNLYFGDGMWGAKGAHHTQFRIGSALISKVSVPEHVMRVYDNGKLIRTMPISAGSPQYPTMGGIHVTINKSPQVIMDSATVGIPKGSPGYYYETVYWDVRISDSGAFVHAAPWSVADQGHVNVSHGCVNLSPTNAQWFYNLSHYEGDVVTVDDPVRGPSSTDPGTMDWNMSWHDWMAGDALHSR